MPVQEGAPCPSPRASFREKGVSGEGWVEPSPGESRPHLASCATLPSDAAGRSCPWWMGPACLNAPAAQYLVKFVPQLCREDALSSGFTDGETGLEKSLS